MILYETVGFIIEYVLPIPGSVNTLDQRDLPSILFTRITESCTYYQNNYCMNMPTRL